MPELAEIKLIADFINQETKDVLVTGFYMRPRHHLIEPSFTQVDVNFNKAYVRAETRGKELLLVFASFNHKNECALKFSLGMSGYFVKQKQLEVPRKHTHLSIILKDGNVLNFVDPRRFGKWKWVDGFDPNRGPDPYFDIFEVGRNLSYFQINKPVKDSTTINELLLNQKYFNGIGNYLRAEILYRINENPFQSVYHYLRKVGINNLMSTLHQVVQEAYSKGGGRIQIWKDPNRPMNEMIPFFRCYNQPGMCKVKDKTNRNFWFDSIWQKEAIKYYSQEIKLK